MGVESHFKKFCGNLTTFTRGTIGTATGSENVKGETTLSSRRNDVFVYNSKRVHYRH